MGELADRVGRREVFDSAVDLWLAVLLIFPAGFSVMLAVALLLAGRPGDSWPLLIVAAGSAAVTAMFTVPCRYTFLEDALSVRCGVVCYQIPFDAITGVEPTSTLASGPALSLKRVRVSVGRKKHILSPRERDRFIERLNQCVARAAR